MSSLRCGPFPDIAIFFVNEKFYHGLGQGLSPAMALQEAPNSLRKMTLNDILQRIEGTNPSF